MNVKSTLLLVILAAAAGIWYWKGDEWGPRIGLPSQAPLPVESPSLQALSEHLTRGQIARIEIAGDLLGDG